MINKRYILGIVGLGLFAHGLLLFTDYSIWDGWWIEAFIRNPNEWAVFERIFSEAGRKLDLLWYLPLLGSGSCVVISKVISVVAWILSAVFVFCLLMQTGILRRNEAFAVAAVAVTLPLYDVLGDLNSLSFSLPIPFFYCGWLLVLHSTKVAGWRRVCAGLGSVPFFAIGFTLPSTLVLFCAFWVLWVFLSAARDASQGLSCSSILKSAARKSPWLAVPVAFWLGKQMFSPTHGYNVSYNAIAFEVQRFAEVYWSLAQLLYRVPLDLLTKHPFAVVVSVIVSAIAVLVLLRAEGRSDIELDDRTGERLIVSGFFLLAATAFPYAAVNQPFAPEGWWTRCNVLLNLPVALLTVGTTLWMQQLLFRGRPRTVLLPLTFVIVVGSVANNINYLAYQGFGAKQEAFAGVLNSVIVDKRPRLVQLRDYFPVDETIPWYPPFIWSSIAANGKALPSAFVVETTRMVPDQVVLTSEQGQQRNVPFLAISESDAQAMLMSTGLPFAFDIPSDSRGQILLAIEPAQVEVNGILLGVQYLKVKWFYPSDLSSFLASLVTYQARVFE